MIDGDDVFKWLDVNENSCVLYSLPKLSSNLTLYIETILYSLAGLEVWLIKVRYLLDCDSC